MWGDDLQPQDRTHKISVCSHERAGRWILSTSLQFQFEISHIRVATCNYHIFYFSVGIAMVLLLLPICLIFLSTCLLGKYTSRIECRLSIALLQQKALNLPYRWGGNHLYTALFVFTWAWDIVSPISLIMGLAEAEHSLYRDSLGVFLRSRFMNRSAKCQNADVYCMR